MKPSKAAKAAALEAATRFLGVANLTEQGRDASDFHDLHVSQLEAALVAAFEAGRAAAKAEGVRDENA